MPTIEPPTDRSIFGVGHKEQQSVETHQLCEVTDPSAALFALEMSKVLPGASEDNGFVTKNSDRSFLLQDRSKKLAMFKHSNIEKTSLPTQNAGEKCKNIQEEICIESLPRTLYVTSRKPERSMQYLKNNFMRNKFDHYKFNGFLESKLGKAYFMGLNQRQPK